MFGFRRSVPSPAVAVRVEPPVMAAETSGVATPAPWLTEIGWGGSGAQSRVKSLPHVTPVTAERHATVFACCNNIAGDLAKVPLQIWQRAADGTEARVYGHRAEYLMNTETSPGVAAAIARYAMVYSFTLRGVSYAYAPRDGAGALTLIDTILPNACNVTRMGRARFYDFQDGAEVQRRAPQRAMVHMR